MSATITISVTTPEGQELFHQRFLASLELDAALLHRLKETIDHLPEGQVGQLTVTRGPGGSTVAEATVVPLPAAAPSFETLFRQTAAAGVVDPPGGSPL
jgi:hypothetical protein